MIQCLTGLFTGRIPHSLGFHHHFFHVIDIIATCSCWSRYVPASVAADEDSFHGCGLAQD
eukprot:11242636-Prorocentrum_lima.AAC.1